MAAAATSRSLFTLTRSAIPFKSIFRALSSISTATPDAATSAADLAPSPVPGGSVDELKKQLFRLRLPKRSATNLLQKWVDDGNPLTLPDLRRLAKDLNRAQRYKHALEIWTWLEDRGSFKMSAIDRSFLVELNIKVHSVLEAEKFFDTLPDRSSKKVACIPLLRYFVKHRDKNKAESFMLKLEALGLTMTTDPLNEIMKLYVSLGHFKKVFLVIKRMKRDKIPRNVLSYNIWMNASYAVSGISSVEAVHMEMASDRNVKIGWSTLCTLANLYTNASLFSKALAALRAAEEKLSTEKRLGYFFLITLYANLSSTDGVIRIWEASKAVPGRFTCANYMCMILCLVKLDAISEAERVFEDWENDCRSYDIRVCNVLLGAYMRKGWMGKAERLYERVVKRGGLPNYKTWEIFMEGWINKREMQKAIDAMKKGFALIKESKWRPPTSLVMTIMEYWEDEGSIEDAEELVKHLHELKMVDAPVYKCLLRMYIRNEQYVPWVLEMMNKDEIKLDEEMAQLMESFCEISCQKKEVYLCK